MRLQKYLAACSIASRRGSEKLIDEGNVTVNGEIAHVGLLVNPEVDEVCVDGRTVNPDDKIYVVLNKPKGVITSAKDTHNRKTVLDCVSGVKARIFPIGRLDQDVTGTLLLTNDGELTHRIAHPSYQIDKVYHAWVQGKMDPKTAIQLTNGIELDDGPTAPAKVTILQNRKSATHIRLIIHEGRKRLVKRMCAAVGHPVRDLQRISIGTIKAKGLLPGEWRYLTHDEIETLKTITEMSHSV